MTGIKASLVTEVSNRFERCLIAPENPFTLDNPDIIVAKGRDLFAIYIPTHKETVYPDYLLRRVYLSQLCYGVKLCPILLTNGLPQNISGYVGQHSFRHIAITVNDAVEFITLEHPHFNRLKHFSEIQARQYERYRMNLELSALFTSFDSLDGFRADSIPLNNRVPVRSWNTGKDKESRNYRFSQQVYVGLGNKGKSSSFKSSFEHLMTLAFMSLYHYDDGELYPTNLIDEMGIINTDWSMFDKERTPNSYNRMLSFIGLAPVTVSTKEQLETLYDSYSTIRDKWAYKRK